MSTIGKWIKQYSQVKIYNDTVMTAKQIKMLQKRNVQLEEENLILKKAIAIFTPHRHETKSYIALGLQYVNANQWLIDVPEMSSPLYAAEIKNTYIGS